MAIVSQLRVITRTADFDSEREGEVGKSQREHPSGGVGAGNRQNLGHAFTL